MMLCFAAAGLLVLTYRSSRGELTRSASHPADLRTAATASPPPSPLLRGDLPSRPGGGQIAIAPAVPAAPQAVAPSPAQAIAPPQLSAQAPAATASPAVSQPAAPSAMAIASPPAPTSNAPSSSAPIATATAPAASQGSASRRARTTAGLPKDSAPARAMAALATGLLPDRFARSAESAAPLRPVASPSPRPSGFVPVQSAEKTLAAIPLHTPRLVVDLSDRRVYFYRGDQLQTSYTVAIGQDGWETPQGSFRVIDRQTYPLWEHPITKELIGNDPRNPLGTRWISFWTDGVHSIGFHGTNRDDSVGQAVSHGCLRMRNADIEALYEEVALGTPVIVRE